MVVKRAPTPRIGAFSRGGPVVFLKIRLAGSDDLGTIQPLLVRCERGQSTLPPTSSLWFPKVRGSQSFCVAFRSRIATFPILVEVGTVNRLTVVSPDPVITLAA